MVKYNDASLVDEGTASGETMKEKKRFECILLLLPLNRFELNSTWVSLVEKSSYFQARESIVH